MGWADGSKPDRPSAVHLFPRPGSENHKTNTSTPGKDISNVALLSYKQVHGGEDPGAPYRSRQATRVLAAHIPPRLKSSPKHLIPSRSVAIGTICPYPGIKKPRRTREMSYRGQKPRDPLIRNKKEIKIGKLPIIQSARIIIFFNPFRVGHKLCHVSLCKPARRYHLELPMDSSIHISAPAHATPAPPSLPYFRILPPHISQSRSPCNPLRLLLDPPQPLHRLLHRPHRPSFRPHVRAARHSHPCTCGARDTASAQGRRCLRSERKWWMAQASRARFQVFQLILSGLGCERRGRGGR